MAVANTVKSAFSLKNVFTLGAVGSAMVAGGYLLAPFVVASAGGAAATAGATNASVLGSFWAPLFTNTTGEVGLTAGLGKMAGGLMALAKSVFAVGSAGVSAIPAGGLSPWEAMSNALTAPAV